MLLELKAVDQTFNLFLKFINIITTNSADTRKKSWFTTYMELPHNQKCLLTL